MNIDERLEKLTTDIESLHATQHEFAERMDQFAAEQRRLDSRERRARKAILEGIKTYLEVMSEGDANEEDESATN